MSRKSDYRLNEFEINITLSALIVDLNRSGNGFHKVDLELVPDNLIVKADRSAFKEAVLALVENAIDAMHSGGTIIVKTSGREAAPNAFAEVAIIDTGIGMAGSIISRACSPYFTTKRNRTGMGMARVHEFAKSVGGSIEVSSEVGVGSKVSILLPMLTAH